MNEIISKINMELQQRQWQPAIDVVQNDRYVRILELTLTSGGSVWNVPEGASVVIRYLRSDGIGGEYDTLSDGTTAWSAAGNLLTVILAPEMMTVSGLVQLWVSIICMEQQISTFALALNVSALAQADQGDTGVFANTTGFLPAPGCAEVGQYFRVRSVNDRGQVTELEAVDLDSEVVLHRAQSLTPEQQLQARINIGVSGSGDLPADVLRWEPQTLTKEQKQQARKNIGAMGAPATAAAGQLVAVKEVDENGVPVEWETVSVQGGTITDAVLFTKQELTAEQKAQARENIGAGDGILADLANQIVFFHVDQISLQLLNCFRYGKICTFTLQFNVNTTISDNYGFTLATLPVAPAGRVWINNATTFYMDAFNKDVRVNNELLSPGNYILTGFFIIGE